MANFLTALKVSSPNMYCLIVSLLLAVWYNGIAGLLNYLFPDRGIVLSLLLIMIPIVIFLTNDGALNELYAYPKDAKDNIHIAAGNVGSYYDPDSSERFRTI